MQFIQIGANVGNTDNDHLWPLVRKHSWAGVLVEPNPKAMAELRRNYADVPGLMFVEKAVAGERGTATLYVDNYALTPGLSQHASCVREHMEVLEHGKHWGEDEEPTGIEVEAITLEDVVELAGLTGKRFALLQIDTEGYDMQIIRAADFVHKVKPQKLIFEDMHSDGPHTRGPIWKDTVTRLQNIGYGLVSYGVDTTMERMI